MREFILSLPAGVQVSLVFIFLAACAIPGIAVHDAIDAWHQRRKARGAKRARAARRAYAHERLARRAPRPL